MFPKTWTHFFSYSQFYKAVKFTRYKENLPKSAYDMRYYYYEGWFSDISGYHAAFTAEDYEMMKENQLNMYDNHSPRKYLYDGIEKKYLDREQIKAMKIDYLDVLLPEDKGDDQFYFLAYDFPTLSSEVYEYDAVLCNDETNEIIELSCRICY